MTNDEIITMMKTQTFDEIEKQVIIARLISFPNKGKGDVARSLGIGKTTLYRKMQKYNIKKIN